MRLGFAAVKELRLSVAHLCGSQRFRRFSVCAVTGWQSGSPLDGCAQPLLFGAAGMQRITTSLASSIDELEFRSQKLAR